MLGNTFWPLLGLGRGCRQDFHCQVLCYVLAHCRSSGQPVPELGCTACVDFSLHKHGGWHKRARVSHRRVDLDYPSYNTLTPSCSCQCWLHKHRETHSAWQMVENAAQRLACVRASTKTVCHSILVEHCTRPKGRAPSTA